MPRNLLFVWQPNYLLTSSVDIVASHRSYYCFKKFFLLESFLRISEIVVVKVTSLVWSKIFSWFNNVGITKMFCLFIISTELKNCLILHISSFNYLEGSSRRFLTFVFLKCFLVSFYVCRFSYFHMQWGFDEKALAWFFNAGFNMYQQITCGRGVWEMACYSC